MIAITPIAPYSPVVAPRKVERDNRGQRQPQKQPKSQQPETESQPRQHIDETV